MVRTKRFLKPYWMLMPATLLVAGLLAWGLSVSLVQSLGYLPGAGLHTFTWAYYQSVLTDRTFIDSLGFSLYISLVSSVVATLLGVLFALALQSLSRRRAFFKSLLQIPVIVPHLVVILMVSTFFSQSGLLARVLYALGLLQDAGQFPALLFEKNAAGILLVYLWKETPFVILTTWSLLERLSDRLPEAAVNLGASRWMVFSKILFPLMAPSVLASFLLIFCFSFGAYEVPLLLGPTYPAALPVRAYQAYAVPDWSFRPYAMVCNVLLGGLCTFLVLLFQKSFTRLFGGRF